MNTNNKKKVLLKAVEYIMNGTRDYSCNAVALAGGESLADEYANFIGLDNCHQIMLPDLPTNKQGRLVRSLAILLFRETL